MDEQDWQISKRIVTKRTEYLLATGKWADCHFVLNGPGNDPETVPGHRLILAMASPVFEAMFYGELAEKDEPILIMDIRPNAFKALLTYIYTDKLNLDSVDKACELCYAAKKYMLWQVVETCTNYIFKDLRPANVCRAYEFAKLFEEPRLMENCLTIICNRTMDLLEDPSFEEADVNTVLTIVEQNVLNINSELSLFQAIVRYAERQQLSLAEQPAEEKEGDGGEGTSSQNTSQNSTDDVKETRQTQIGVLRLALKKVRFLTMTPQEFAEGPGRSKLFTQSEAFKILMNISSRDTSDMPEGFTTTREHRTIGSFRFQSQNAAEDHSNPLTPPSAPNRPQHLSDRVEVNSSASPELFPSPPALMEPSVRNSHHLNLCNRFIHTLTDCLNTSILDCSLTFTVDRSICITGCQVPTQVLGGTNIPPTADGNFPQRYTELLYAHLLDSLGHRLTYTHCTSRVSFDAMLEIWFDRPVFVQKEKLYKIGVIFNKVGWYPMAKCSTSLTCNEVHFTFAINSLDSIRDGLIRGIMFNDAGGLAASARR